MKDMQLVGSKHSSTSRCVFKHLSYNAVLPYNDQHCTHAAPTLMQGSSAVICEVQEH